MVDSLSSGDTTLVVRPHQCTVVRPGVRVESIGTVSWFVHLLRHNSGVLTTIGSTYGGSLEVVMVYFLLLVGRSRRTYRQGEWFNTLYYFTNNGIR